MRRRWIVVSGRKLAVRARITKANYAFETKKGEITAKTVDNRHPAAVPSVNYATDRRKFSPGVLCSLVPEANVTSSRPRSPPEQTRRSAVEAFAGVKTKSVDDASTITVCSRPGPWSWKRKARAGLCPLRNPADTFRFQSWSNTLFFFKRSRNLKSMCEKNLFARRNRTSSLEMGSFSGHNVWNIFDSQMVSMNFWLFRYLVRSYSFFFC